MSEFVPELLRRMWVRICRHRDPANGRRLTSILPLQQSPPSARLPWEPGRIELTHDELQLLAWLWQELSQELGPEEVISHSDVLHFALQELQLKFQSGHGQDVLLRLGFHLSSARHWGDALPDSCTRVQLWTEPRK
jgi:hypothetical protein